MQNKNRVWEPGTVVETNANRPRSYNVLLDKNLKVYGRNRKVIKQLNNEYNNEANEIYDKILDERLHRGLQVENSNSKTLDERSQVHVSQDMQTSSAPEINVNTNKANGFSYCQKKSDHYTDPEIFGDNSDDDPDYVPELDVENDKTIHEDDPGNKVAKRCVTKNILSSKWCLDPPSASRTRVHNTVTKMVKSNNANAFKLQHAMMLSSGVWPEESSTITYKIKCIISWILSLGLFITMTMQVIHDITDFTKLSEILYIMVTIAATVGKMASFTYQRKKFLKMIKFLKEPIFMSYTDDLDHYMAATIKSSTFIANFYRYLVGCCIVMFIVYPIVDNKPLPFPFSFELGSFKYCMYVFQIASIGCCAWNNSCIDTLTTSIMGIGAAQLSILYEKIVNIKHMTNCLEDKNNVSVKNKDITPSLEQCVEHHNAIIILIDYIEEVFTVGLLAQFVTSVMVILTMSVKSNEVLATDPKFEETVLRWYAECDSDFSDQDADSESPITTENIITSDHKTGSELSSNESGDEEEMVVSESLEDSATSDLHRKYFYEAEAVTLNAVGQIEQNLTITITMIVDHTWYTKMRLSFLNVVGDAADCYYNTIR
ncbi:hypothetical protein RN001_001469 [Aquatica leii]|uniref:Odorant receptor n=1 Tax=Aquatica leii TaxID=1421715 RepID=A0AAN7QMW6_9COLE|nr:hypothetical protein RN001_001469 [Aquatica leii]